MTVRTMLSQEYWTRVRPRLAPNAQLGEAAQPICPSSRRVARSMAWPWKRPVYSMGISTCRINGSSSLSPSTRVGLSRQAAPMAGRNRFRFELTCVCWLDWRAALASCNSMPADR